LESAAVVAVDDDTDKQTLLFHMSSLVEKSLVVSDTTHDTMRYRMLESTRHFALELLRAEDDADRRRRRLAQHLVSLYAEAEEIWPITATEIWLKSYAPDLDNVRTSIEWAFGGIANGAQIGLELVSRSLRLLVELSLFPEARRWFKTSSRYIQDETSLHTKARLIYGRSYLSDAWFGSESAAEPALAAAALFRTIGNSRALAECLVRAAQAILSPAIRTAISRTHANRDDQRGQPGDLHSDQAEELLNEAFSILKPLGRSKILANCLLTFGVLRDFEGNLVAGRQRLNEAADMFESIQDHFGTRYALICLAENAFHSGRIETALSTIRDVIHLASQQNHRHTLCLARMNLAAYLLLIGRVDEAREVAKKGLDDSRALGLSAYTHILLEHLALAAALSGLFDKATRILGFTDSRRAAMRTAREDTENKIYQRLTSLLSVAITSDVRRALTLEGTQMTESQVIDEAMSL
jgi:hypothetical protein